MNRAIKIIQEIPSNKAGIKLFADALVSGVMSGEVDPLEVRAKVDAIEKILKAVKDSTEFRDVVLDAADQYGEKTFEHNGVKFTKAESARYDYSRDEQWINLKEGEVAIATERKSHEAILKALKEETVLKIGEGSEKLLIPPVKSSSTTVRVTF